MKKISLILISLFVTGVSQAALPPYFDSVSKIEVALSKVGEGDDLGSIESVDLDGNQVTVTTDTPCTHTVVLTIKETPADANGTIVVGPTVYEAKSIASVCAVR
jgi:hypothetical protein